jgi:hypothetical protein
MRNSTWARRTAILAADVAAAVVVLGGCFLAWPALVQAMRAMPMHGMR